MCSTGTSPPGLSPGVVLPRDFSEAVYEKLADETLDALVDYFEDLSDQPFTGANYDVEFSVSLYVGHLKAVQHNGAGLEVRLTTQPTSVQG